VSVLGGDDDEIKLAASQLAKQATGLAHALTIALAASAAVPGPHTAGLGVAVAACHAWAWVQQNVADDPPRDDWWDYPPSLPEEIRQLVGTGSQAWEFASVRAHGLGSLDNWTAMAMAHTYSTSAALRSAERLASIRQRPTFADWSIADLQRGIGRHHLRRAAIYSSSLGSFRFSIVDGNPELAERLAPMRFLPASRDYGEQLLDALRQIDPQMLAASLFNGFGFQDVHQSVLELNVERLAARISDPTITQDAQVNLLLNGPTGFIAQGPSSDQQFDELTRKALRWGAFD
jgi:hypothetical protein